TQPHPRSPRLELRGPRHPGARHRDPVRPDAERTPGPDLVPRASRRLHDRLLRRGDPPAGELRRPRARPRYAPRLQPPSPRLALLRGQGNDAGRSPPADPEARAHVASGDGPFASDPADGRQDEERQRVSDLNDDPGRSVVAVIGGGFTGTMVAVHLARLA